MATTGQSIGAAGDLFQGIAGFVGGMASAKAYKQAAKYAEQNAIISREAGDIRLAQEGRQIFKTLGAQQAGYAGAGLVSSGSAQSVLRDSVAQGALEKAIINAQTMINVLGYKSQAVQFKGMAKAAKAGAWGDLISGVASAAGTLAMSDDRLKSNIVKVGKVNGFNIYDYDIFGQRQRGVIASEIVAQAPHALGPTIEGYMTVDYGKLGLAYLLTEEGQGRA